MKTKTHVEREAFEMWMHENSPAFVARELMRDDKGAYINASAHWMWLGWCGRVKVDPIGDAP